MSTTQRIETGSIFITSQPGQQLPSTQAQNTATVSIAKRIFDWLQQIGRYIAYGHTFVKEMDATLASQYASYDKIPDNLAEKLYKILSHSAPDSKKKLAFSALLDIVNKHAQVTPKALKAVVEQLGKMATNPKAKADQRETAVNTLLTLVKKEGLPVDVLTIVIEQLGEIATNPKAKADQQKTILNTLLILVEKKELPVDVLKTVGQTLLEIMVNDRVNQKTANDIALKLKPLFQTNVLLIADSISTLELLKISATSTLVERKKTLSDIQELQLALGVPSNSYSERRRPATATSFGLVNQTCARADAVSDGVGIVGDLVGSGFSALENNFSQVALSLANKRLDYYNELILTIAAKTELLTDLVEKLPSA